MTAFIRTDACHSKASERPAVVSGNRDPGCVPQAHATSRQANKDIPQTCGSPRSCSDKALSYVTNLQPPRETGEEEADLAAIENENINESSVKPIRSEPTKNILHRSELLEGAHDQFNDCDLDEEQDDWDPIRGNDSSKKTFEIHGSEELQTQIKLLLEEYKDIFSDKLNRKPANSL